LGNPKAIRYDGRMAISIVLPREKQELATTAGTARYWRRKNSKHKNNRQDETTIENVIGEIGSEIACGLVLGIEWVDSPFPDPEGDLGPGIQVRLTKYPQGKLILNPKPFGLSDDDRDDPDHRFYLVTGKFPRYKVHGSMMCWQAIDQHGISSELQAGRLCLHVKQHLLDPIDLNNKGPNPWKGPTPHWWTQFYPRVEEKKIIFGPPASEYKIQGHLFLA